MYNLKRTQIAGMNQSYRGYSFHYFLESMQRAGYQNIELWLGPPHFHLDSITYSDCGEIRRLCSDYGLTVVAATSPSGGALHYQYASQNKDYRERSIRYFAQGLRATAELGAGIMTANPGWGYWDAGPEEAHKHAVETLVAVAREAEALGIRVALESLTPEESQSGYSLAQVKRIINEVNSPALNAMVDLAAIRYNGEGIQDWFDAFGADLIHFHFQDGDRSPPTPGHYAWGAGSFPLEADIRCLARNGYQGYLTQEICGSQHPREDDMFTMETLSRYFER